MHETADSFAQAAVAYYFRMAGMRARFNDIASIGFPLQIFFPKAGIAFEITDTAHYGRPDRHKERLKNALCEKYGVLLFRFLESWEQEYRDRKCVCIVLMNNTDQAIAEALEGVFRILGMDCDINIPRDRNAIRSLVRQEHEEPD